MDTIVYLVRHAQAQPLPSVPDAEWDLSAHGHAQAAALIPILGGFAVARVYSSPFRRCRETVRPFAEKSGVRVQLHDGLRERCLGTKWLGDFRDVWRRSWEDFSFAMPDGETSFACRARISATVGEIVARHAGETIAVLSHGNAIGLLLTTLDPAFGIAEASSLRTPELLRLVHDGDSLDWDRGFAAGDAFDAIATDFRLTPGIVA